MSCELYIHSKPESWIWNNVSLFMNYIQLLPSNSKIDNETIYLLSIEKINTIPEVIFRFNFEEQTCLMEVNAHPKDITVDLLSLFNNIKKHTQLIILDEDGEVSEWGTLSLDEYYKKNRQ